MYLAYDITGMLRKGDNAIGAILGNGFYDATTGWVCPFGTPRFLCQLELTYADGRTETVVTDDSWKAAQSAIIADGPFDGEVYDARCEIPGWDTPGFDDRAWPCAAYRRAPDGELTAHTAPTDKVTETFVPVALNRNGDGSWEVSFPVELSGWIRFKDLKAQKGDTIDVKYHCDQPLGVKGWKGQSCPPFHMVCVLESNNQRGGKPLSVGPCCGSCEYGAGYNFGFYRIKCDARHNQHHLAPQPD